MENIVDKRQKVGRKIKLKKIMIQDKLYPVFTSQEDEFEVPTPEEETPKEDETPEEEEKEETPEESESTEEGSEV